MYPISSSDLIAFNGLTPLAGDEYNWLLENVQAYMMTQDLPSSWVATEQIRQVMARIPRRPNTIQFLENYHKLEISVSNSNNPQVHHDEPARKRVRIEEESQKESLEVVATSSSTVNGASFQ